jgi:hypothetical protein
MRSSVKKPVITHKAIHSSKPEIQKSHLGTSVKRSEAAKQTLKSEQVHKYGTINHRTSVISNKSSSLAVREQSTLSSSVHSLAQKPTIHQPTKPTASKTQSHINKAIENSHSHEEIHHENKSHSRKSKSKLIHKLGISKKASALSSGVLAAVLLAGFFTVQNVPNLSMQIAATRAGFDAQMPGYQPSGFSFRGPINYSAGQVTVSFGSNSDGRFYDVKQQASNWNSDALLSNYVVAEGKTYQTYLDKGRTLFIYDGSNATWVDNGVWYQVEGDSNMTTDQLIRIASSI